MKETPRPVRKPRAPVAGKSAAKPAATKGKTAVRKKAAGVLSQGTQPSAGYDDNERIHVAAYYLAERRGFVRGHELADWLAAEAEVTGSAGAQRRRRTDRSLSVDTPSAK